MGFQVGNYLAENKKLVGANQKNCVLSVGWKKVLRLASVMKKEEMNIDHAKVILVILKNIHHSLLLQTIKYF